MINSSLGVNSVDRLQANEKRENKQLCSHSTRSTSGLKIIQFYLRFTEN